MFAPRTPLDTTQSPIRPLYLTNGLRAIGNARIVQHYLRMGRPLGLEGAVVVQTESSLTDWLREQDVPYLVSKFDPMKKSWPWPVMRRLYQVIRFARQHRCNVIHCNEHNVYAFGRLVARAMGLPVVCHVRYHIDRAFGEWAFRWPHRTPDALMFTSHQQRHDCRDGFQDIVPPERQHVVRLGLDLGQTDAFTSEREATRQAWAVQPDEILISSACPIRPRKRIDDFIDLLIDAAQRHPNVVGIIAGGRCRGDEDYYDRLQQRVAKTGLGRRLQMVGHIEPVEPLMHATDIFVSTSEYETFGNSVMEAMAARCPVVGYRGGSVLEVVGDAGSIVETGELDQLKQQLDALLREPRQIPWLGELARKRVEDNFQASRAVQQVLNIYEQLGIGQSVAHSAAEIAA